MAFKRKRGGSWEYRIQRKGLLSKTLNFSFKDEAEGDKFCALFESYLDRGELPPGYREDASEQLTTLAESIDAYLHAVHVKIEDRSLLNLVRERHGGLYMIEISYSWGEGWIARMKQVENLSPSTIRKYVGALARCLDWVENKESKLLPHGNPLRKLPKGYSSYTVRDQEAVRKAGLKVKHDVERDRRLEAHEEKAIRKILAGAKSKDRQRPLELKYQPALELLFDLALESAMRLREMFTLELKQVDERKRTVFLDRTKNGDKRQVPLSSVALAKIKAFNKQVKKEDPRMFGWSFEGGRLFPWWDGDRETLAKVTIRLSRQFGRIFEVAGCPDLVFHDLRHEATSRLYERTDLSDLEISNITGHKDPRMLKRYANLRGSDLANRMW